MARRARYGGREADEFRPSKDSYEEALADLEVAEGKEVAEIRRLLQFYIAEPTNPSRKAALESYLAELKEAGWAANRVESMLIRASAKLSLTPKKPPKPVSARV